MRLTVLATVVFSVSVSLFAQTPQSDPVAQAMANLNRIETLYFKNLTKQERVEAVRLLNETRGILVGIGQPPQNTPPPKDLNLLSDEGFQSLLGSVKNEISDSSKTKIVLSIGRNGRITTAQLEKLIVLYTFDSYREDLIRSVIDNVVDPVNMGLVLRHFDSSITRDNLAKWLQNR